MTALYWIRLFLFFLYQINTPTNITVKVMMIIPEVIPIKTFFHNVQITEYVVRFHTRDFACCAPTIIQCVQELIGGLYSNGFTVLYIPCTVEKLIVLNRCITMEKLDS